MIKLIIIVGAVYFTLINVPVTIEASRVKRFLAFPNQTTFLVRLSIKVNMLAWTSIFAEAVGFRINFAEAPSNFHHHGPLKLHRRELYRNLETLFDKNGLDGFNCIRRAICEVHMLPPSSGLYPKLLHIIFRRKSSATDAWHGGAGGAEAGVAEGGCEGCGGTTWQACAESFSACPLSLLDVSLYTDQ